MRFLPSMPLTLRLFCVVTQAIYALLATGALATLVMAFLWDKAWLGHSVALLVLTGLAAVADCTSTVTFYPYCGRYPAM